jgi:FdhD protein
MSKRPSASKKTVATKIHRWSKGQGITRCRDVLAREEPLEIRVQGRSVAVTMRTPGHDEELAAGFLLTEGLIQRREQVVEIAHCQQGEAAMLGNIVNVFLAAAVRVNFKRLTRHVFASSSCGLCGKASIEAVQQHFSPVTTRLKLSPADLLNLPGKMRDAQLTFARTGGLHAAAIFDGNGRCVVLREDVGRHNALDKAIGHGLLNGLLPFSEHVLLVSGRASFEIMQKALAAGIGVVAAVSAPSSLAVEFAAENGQTLVGFLRENGMNIYSGSERIHSQ